MSWIGTYTGLNNVAIVIVLLLVGYFLLRPLLKALWKSILRAESRRSTSEYEESERGYSEKYGLYEKSRKSKTRKK